MKTAFRHTVALTAPLHRACALTRSPHQLVEAMQEEAS
jgi:hypothetical protein